jgi:hypothetical protein
MGVFMKNKIGLLLALSLLIMLAMAFASPADDEAEACWQKGVNAALLSQDYLPRKIYMKFEQLDGDGKAKNRNELWLELAPGEKEARLVKAVENGKDTTREELEKERKRKERSKGKSDGQTLSVSAADIVPLLTNVKKPVAHNYLGREMKNGVDCNAYEFRKEYLQKRGKKEEAVIHHGKIWLDAGSGMAVEAAYSQDPLPSMVKQLEMNTTFMAHGDKVFVKNHNMVIKAGFLFIKKRFRMNLVLDDYWKSEKEDQDAR